MEGEFTPKITPEIGEIPKNVSVTSVLCIHEPHFYPDVINAVKGGDYVVVENVGMRDAIESPKEQLQETIRNMNAFNAYISGNGTDEEREQLAAWVEAPGWKNDLGVSIARGLKGTSARFLYVDRGITELGSAEMKDHNVRDAEMRRKYFEAIFTESIDRQLELLGERVLMNCLDERSRELLVANQVAGYVQQARREFGDKPLDFRLVQGHSHRQTADILERAGAQVKRIFIPSEAISPSYLDEIKLGLDNSPILDAGLLRRHLLEKYLQMTALEWVDFSSSTVPRKLIDTLDDSQVQGLLEDFRSHFQKGKGGRLTNIRLQRFASKVVADLQRNLG